jgi:hypothetical protein
MAFVQPPPPPPPLAHRPSIIAQWAVRQSAEVENQLISVERLMEFARLPVEDVDITPDHPATVQELTGWPTKGAITLAGVK